jgi:hypothetical protein
MSQLDSLCLPDQLNSLSDYSPMFEVFNRTVPATKPLLARIESRIFNSELAQAPPEI